MGDDHHVFMAGKQVFQTSFDLSLPLDHGCTGKILYATVVTIQQNVIDREFHRDAGNQIAEMSGGTGNAMNQQDGILTAAMPGKG